MSQGQPTSTTRRSFLGTATIATAATAATLTASPIAQGEQADKIRVAQTPTEAKPTPPAAPVVKQGDWSKPAAMAIPKGGVFKQELGR
ncbi:MAG: twin-arginine translocation signal domain-containing protein, partial [Pseudolabrys sp.]